MAEVLTRTERAELATAATSYAHDRGLELLRVDIRGTRSRPVIEVVLDGERQVTIDDCETLSKLLQSHLDGVLGAQTNYRLDVLSPGVDEPLKYPYQFKRSIGRKLEILTTDNVRHVGRLSAVGTDTITLAIEAKTKQAEPSSQEIPSEGIQKAKVVLEF